MLHSVDRHVWQLLLVKKCGLDFGFSFCSGAVISGSCSGTLVGHLCEQRDRKRSEHRAVQNRAENVEKGRMKRQTTHAHQDIQTSIHSYSNTDRQEPQRQDEAHRDNKRHTETRRGAQTHIHGLHREDTKRRQSKTNKIAE